MRFLLRRVRRLVRHSVYAALTIALVLVAGCRGSIPEGAVTVNIALPIEQLDLPNGLHVVLHPERSASLALVYVRYDVGSKDDPVGRSGFAHFFEHLMFRGSKNTGSKDYAQWLEDVGGIFNASTNLDETDYHAYVPPEALPRALWLEADRMAYPLAQLDEAGFSHERDVVKNEWREHYEDVPLGNLRSIAREAIFGADHPYGTSPIGRADELDHVTLAEAHAFARTYYRPNNATLIVAGSFDVPAVRDMVQRYFGTIAPGRPRSIRALPPAKVRRSRELLVEADVEGPAVMVAWPAPATHGDGMEELRYGFGLLAWQVSRRLVAEKKIANTVEDLYETGRLGGLVTLLVRLKPGAEPSTAISVIDEYLDSTALVGRVTTWDNFSSFKTRVLVNEIGTMESLEGRAVRILHDLELHGAPNAMQGDLRRLQSVDSSDVGDAVQHFLIDGPRITIVVRPNPGMPRSGRTVSR